MPRFSLPALLAAVCLALPAFALELSDLRLPLTRGEADKVLSKDYSFRVLEDMTVRRSWELGNRTVSVDFSPKDDDKAVMIFVDYNRPVSVAVAAQDAEAMMGISSGRWTAVKPENAKRLGMLKAEGIKQEGGRLCFRELDRKGRVTRLAYCDGAPKVARWELADDARDTGKTAMGSRSSGGSSEYLWKDEERRRGVSASSSIDSLASAAAAVVADAPAAPADRKPKMIERPEDPVDVVATVQEWMAKLTPTHYAIGAAVVVVLVILRLLARAREARRRAMVADYIMRKGKIDTGSKGLR